MQAYDGSRMIVACVATRVIWRHTPWENFEFRSSQIDADWWTSNLPVQCVFDQGDVVQWLLTCAGVSIWFHSCEAELIKVYKLQAFIWFVGCGPMVCIVV